MGGLLLVALSGASFGALGLFGRLAYASGTDVPTLLFLRFTLAGLVLAAVMRVRGERFPRGRVLLALCLLGGVGYVSESLAYFGALALAPAGLVALLLYLYPALVALLSVWVERERLGPGKLAAVALAFAGTCLTLDLSGAGGAVRPLGIALGVLSAFIYALYILASARVLRHAGALGASTVITLSAGAVYAGLVLARGPRWPQTGVGWSAVGGLALLGTVVAVLALLAGMARVGAVSAALLSTMEPLVAVLLGALFLHERLSAAQGVGGACILAAVVLLARLDAAAARAAAAEGLPVLPPAAPEEAPGDA
ncbi:EamA family transporter [Aggregicoccus sp. 17bor-14]|nr:MULTISPECIES: EamA family transporter [Myxococcaceae]MBF5045338.1 EamA family transporter [Simulacricoccus sp. 17bor-14]MRI91080.1 EamA family transporter [Aggregicoccus sp. 17bor-14]